MDASASDPSVQLGPRPFYLVDKMSPSPLRRALQQCGGDSFIQSTFSIGHRGGGPLQFPEHTKESHEAGARMGAGERTTQAARRGRNGGRGDGS